MKKNIYVVGAIIVDGDKVFCAQRGRDTSLPLLWEFPGGKIEHGESPQEALKREIQEEMQCNITVGDKVEHTVYEYDFGIVHLTTYFCEITEGSPVLTEHERFEWLHVSKLRTLEWAPADIPAINKVLEVYKLK